MMGIATMGTEHSVADPVQIDFLAPSLGDRFRTFHEAHPQVYRLLVKFARKWKLAGHKKCGIKMLWERVRWEIGIEGLPDSDEDFKLNNNYHSRYARLIMRQESDLRDFFETRELRSQ
jgi:hypothetical protein